tara:strand:+ start:138 stop:611 length:474 start_codon:yes stop_codon:yes gene_type:complete
VSGFVYLIRNKDLYKIGITQNLEQRMKTLKPDEIVSTLKTDNYQQLEKKLHKRYKNVRLPQSEYFRLDDSQISDCKSQLNTADSNEATGPVNIITNWYDPDPRNKGIKRSTKIDRFFDSIRVFFETGAFAIFAFFAISVLIISLLEQIPIIKWLFST